MASCGSAVGPQGGRESGELSSSVLLQTVKPLIPRLSLFSSLQLQANVNLNLPPPNWLRASSPATAFSRTHFSLRTVADSEPSSTILASHYPHVVGEVDVVSDSKSIKKMLKLPYCGSPLSMAIHRVGETLLIDEFAAPMAPPTGVSSSLDKLFEGNNLLQLWFTARKKHPALTRHRNMYSKLLYYSLADRALPPATTDPVTTQPPTDSVSPPLSSDISTLTEDSIDLTPSSTSDQYRSRTGLAGDQNQLRTGLAGDQDQSDQLRTGGTATELGGSVEEVSIEEREDETVRRKVEMNALQFEDRGFEAPSTGIGPTDIDRGSLEVEVPRAEEDEEEEEEKFIIPASFLSSPAVVEERKREIRASCGGVGKRDGGGREEREGGGDETGMERETEDQPGKSTGFPYTPPPPNQRRFYHDVQWDIADIRMLLGSDLPIFGSDSHPAISLRLRDMRRPITVLTGLDYWLDNLMCNVPELAMCFHLDGIVQRYEMVKTEDIPNLENSEFSPKEVLEVAQNILAFLKANCTREGHTYWLFRQRGEEVVKLYDITSLMETSSREEEEEGKAQNPFARSVAVLFYRVARNMLNPPGSSRGSSRLSSAVTGEELSMAKLLLENCVRLLRDSRHSDDVNVGSSACYLLADLYLSRSPSDSTPSPDGPPDIRGRSRDRKLSLDSDSGETEGREGVGGPLSYLDSKSLSVRALREGHLTFPCDPTHPLPSLLVTSSTDRARLALQSIAKGLDMLGESLFVPRPRATSETPLAHTCGSHLLQKAGSAYLCLARTCTKTGKHGRALRYTRCALLCFRGSRECAGGDGGEMLDHLLSWQQCGDLHCLLSRTSCLSDFEDFWLENPEDTPLISTATRLRPPEPDSKEEACLTIHSNRETSLWRSIDCYEKALQLGPSVRLSEAQSSGVLLTLRTHFGSVWNELGTHYMVTASSLDYAKERVKVEKLWNCSHACLNRGLDLFSAADSTSTSVNRSSTYANLGCLMRACASVHSRLAEAQGLEFTSEEKAYYEKSLEYYTTAQQLLRHQRVEPEFWSSLMCDLGLMYNTLARHLLDRPPLSKLSPVEVERKVMDSLLKSLHCIEPQLSAVDINSPRFPVIHQLAGESHYRLGCLYQKTACGRSSSCSAQKLKHSRSQAEKHFNKAFQYYLPEHHAKEILKLLLDKSTLFELQVQQGQGIRLQLKLLESALSSLLQCQTALCHYQPCHEHETQPVESQQETKEEVEEGRRGEERSESAGDALTSLLLTRLLTILKQLVSIAMKKSDLPKSSLAGYKAMYAAALRGSQSRSGTISEQIQQARVCLKTVTGLWPD